MAIYFTSASGNDANSGTILSPFRTLAKGTSVLAAGDTLNVRGGTYLEDLQQRIPAGISTSSPTVVQAYSLGGVYEPAVVQPTSGRCVLITGRSFITLRGLVLNGINGTTLGSDNAVKFEISSAGVHSDHFTIEDCEVKNINATALLGETANYAIIRNNYIHTIGSTSGGTPYGHGIYTGGPTFNTGWIIEDNTFDTINLYGTQLYPQNTNSIIRRNVYHATQGSAINSGGIMLANSGHICENNIVYGARTAGNSAIQVSFQGPANTTVRNNTCYGIGSGNGIYVDVGATGIVVQNNIAINFSTNLNNQAGSGATLTSNLTTGSASTIFTNAAGGDFTLKLGSPAIDTGVTLVAVTVDIIGTARPQGTRYDIGAYERLVGVDVTAPATPTGLQVI